MLYRRVVSVTLIPVLLVTLGCGGGAGLSRHTSKSSNPVQPAGTVSPADSAYLGDMDGDEQASVGNAINILRIVVGLDDADPRADANESGTTDVGDAILVLRCVVGLDTWPIGVLGQPYEK